MLNEIANVIGTDATVKLGQAMGGARLRIPTKYTPDSLVVMILGEETAQKLCHHFAGDTIDIPSKRQFRQVRDALIREDYATIRLRGCKASYLAVKYGVSRRQVFNITK